ncbi:MAG: aminodeoxychorismate synthase, component, partial [Pseudomonadota bacterium]
MKCVLDFPGSSGARERHIFDTPVEIIRADSLDDVLPAIEALEAHQRAGRYCVGFIGYDAAPAFDAAMTSRRDPRLPLIAFGVYEKFVKVSPQSFTPARLAHWQLDTSPEDYSHTVDRLRQDIQDGVAYQVNFTLRAKSPMNEGYCEYYEQLRRAQACDYCAYIELDDLRVMSASPELFFSIEHGVITTRPMKGTAPRGRWPEEDEQLKDALLRSEKERAENLMIVDLLRNDLARVSINHGVRVNKLFEIERYPTLYQMTSTVEAKLREGVGLVEVLRAIFPCGSVTG